MIFFITVIYLIVNILTYRSVQYKPINFFIFIFFIVQNNIHLFIISIYCIIYAIKLKELLAFALGLLVGTGAICVWASIEDRTRFLFVDNKFKV